MYSHRPFVFVDIETTGGSQHSTRILDIGVIRVENGSVVGKMNQLVYPETSVPSFITNLTGITNDMVWNQPSFKAIASDLEILFKDAIFIAHNVEFDYGIIKREFKLAGVEFNMDRACTVKLSRLLHPEQRGHSLDRVIEGMGLHVEHRHRGYDDALVLRKFVDSEMKAGADMLLRSLKEVTTYSRKARSAFKNQLNLF